ncbi:hypothetical protein WMY93_008142 [Mugilogobius chulae]|uniref:C-type lectin domain-containing protein n=1 Tax=Mugilogobius chulae TaxID=88201 RepID=A0AAW0PI52_9GOBI
MDDFKSRNTRYTKNSGRVTEPGKWFLLVGISFGLLCMVQASLNIYLRLFVLHPHTDLFSCNDRKSTDLCKRKDTFLDKVVKISVSSPRNLLLLTETITVMLLLKNTVSFAVLETRARETTQERDRLRLKLIERHTSEVWVYFQGSLYLGSSTEQSWNESRQYCQQRGADLSIITSVQEQNFARATFNDSRWIGLSDLEQEGVWKWSLISGSSVCPEFPSRCSELLKRSEINF